MDAALGWRVGRSGPAIDSMMRNTYLCIMLTEGTLLQTRVGRKTAAAARAIAVREGITVAAWLRRTILKEVDGMMIPAWVAPTIEDARAMRGNIGVFLLRSEKDISSTERVFELLTQGGAPLVSGLQDYGAFKSPDAHWWWLRGGVRGWRLVNSFSDGKTTHVVLRSTDG